MRTFKVFCLGLAIAALPIAALAQESSNDQTKPATPAVSSAKPNATDETGRTSGSFEFGARTTSFTGDIARYDRYGDLRNGLFLDNIRFDRDKNGFVLQALGVHVGRLDQRLEGSLIRPGVLKVFGYWDQTPMLMSDTTRTMYVATAPNQFVLPANLQTQIAANTTLMAGLANQYSTPFDLKNQRHTGAFGLEYLLSTNTTIKLDGNRVNREGAIPYTTNFGSSNIIELPQPVQHHTTDIDGSIEHQIGDLRVRVGYMQSWFRNDFSYFTFSNPYITTDTTSKSSIGRETLAPSNNFSNLYGSVSYLLPRHTRIQAFYSMGRLDDNGAEILPFTLNTAMLPVTLPRTTVNGNVHSQAGNLLFTSRPIKNLSVTVKYRHNDAQNLTPIFSTSGVVKYDSSFNATTVLTSQYHTTRFDTADADVHYSTIGHTVFSAGYTWKQAGYRNRLFADSTDKGFHVAADMFNAQWIQFHVRYDRTHRTTTEPEDAADVMRTYDIAARNRNSATMKTTITPIDWLAVTAQVAYLKDEYPDAATGLSCATTTGCLFGMVNAKRLVYTLGFDVNPTDKITISASYDLQDNKGLQTATRTSSGYQYVWTTNSNDKLHSMMANFQVREIVGKFDVQLGFDRNRATSSYLYDIPVYLTRGAGVDPASTLSQLPNILNDLTRATFDISYPVTKRLRLGVGYWYEEYKVDDFAMGTLGVPQITLPVTSATPTTLLLGYTYLPYKVNAVFGRLAYSW